MGIRGVIKDILILYLGYKILKLAVTKTPPTASVIIVTLILIILSLWFITERLGIMPH